VDVVEVTGSLDLVVTEAQQGLVRFLVAVLLHVPSWGSVGNKQLVQVGAVSPELNILRAEIDSES
jgi:hypothetical protein